MRITGLSSLFIAFIGAALISGCGGDGGSADPVTPENELSSTPSDSSFSTGTAVLSWTPPIEKTDGSALTDLSGYRIYYGTEEGEYDTTVYLDNPGLSEYVLENIPAGQEYYFVITAFDSNGVESAESNYVTKNL